MTDIRLYGNDHSPWVQAVMLGLHEKQIAYRRSTVPAPEAFIQWGVTMPAASFDGEPWQLESSEILERLGYSPVSTEDMQAVRRTWRGVLHRADVWTRFWGEFALAGDPCESTAGRLIRNFLRSFTMLYFFLLIRFAALTRRQPDPDDFAEQFLDWEERLGSSKQPFIGGDAPDSVDLLLFGIIQCHASIWVPPILALQSDPRLSRFRMWIGDMQQRFEHYPSLYSGVYFEPHTSAPEHASATDQFAFWLGAIFMVGCFWITVPLVVLLAYRNHVLRG